MQALSESFGIAIVLVRGGQGDTSHPDAYQGHALICECGQLLADCTGSTAGENIHALESFCVARDLDCDILNACRRFASRTPANILLTENDGKKGLMRTVSADPFLPDSEQEASDYLDRLFDLQVQGLVARVANTGLHRLVLGVSGGLDSTLALLVAVRALDLLGRPRTDMVAVTMPGFGTTSRTRSNAEILCEKLGVTLRTVSIAAAVRQHFQDIGHDEKVTDVTYENAQARERTQVLMDIANQQNGIVVGTGDLSELALGWATYNGDHMSMYGVNGSIPKTLVRYLVRHAADTCGDEALAAVLYDILDTPVSPELLPAEEDGTIAQKTEDLVGPYELHDFFLYHFIRYGCPPRKILHLAELAFAGRYDRAAILKWLRTFFRRFFQQQFKRSCLPDGPKVGSVTLSPRGDWRMPSDASAALWLRELEDLQ